MNGLQGIRVRVRSVYVRDRSQPCKQQYFFAYRIRISNEGFRSVQLLSRHWIITDAAGKIEHVRWLYHLLSVLCSQRISSTACICCSCWFYSLCCVSVTKFMLLTLSEIQLTSLENICNITLELWLLQIKNHSLSHTAMKSRGSCYKGKC